MGIGLSQLFSASGLEAADIGGDEARANSMGLFLQKTNIIRDYLEDLHEGRTWWPEEVWSKYAGTLESLAQPQTRAQAVQCLNHLVTDALSHIPDVFSYMSQLRNQSVFNFCAIPQVMAVATLALCFNNPNVFTGVVKIRKGQAVGMMMQATSMPSVYAIFAEHIAIARAKLQPADPSYQATVQAIETAERLISKAGVPLASPPSGNPVLLGLVAATVAAGAYYLWKNPDRSANLLPAIKVPSFKAPAVSLPAVSIGTK